MKALSSHRAASAGVCLSMLLSTLGAPHVLAGVPRTADVILVGGHIHSEDGRDAVVEALAIQAGRIIAAGTNEQIRAIARKGARVIDLHGLAATPGLIDTHAHLADGGMEALKSVDLSGATSIDDIRRAVAARAATLPAGAWLTGSAWDEGKLAERRYVRAADLEDVAPRNPVWLEHTTGHYGTANGAALRLAGIAAATADPPAGTIDRDAKGQPTGVLKESAQNLVQNLIPAPTPAQWRQAILANLDLMHREGMTAVKDPDIRQFHWDAYAGLAREGRLSAHVCVLWHAEPSLEDASLSTWIHPRDGTEYIYYPKGSLAGFLLDVIIRDASGNRRSLDDVMRELYNSDYKSNRGFTSDEWWAAVSRAANGKSFTDFYARYVDGRDPCPYGTVLPLAGLRLVRDTINEPRVGIGTVQDRSGVHVTQVVPLSSADAAGVQPGDLLLAVGGISAGDPTWSEQFRAKYARAPQGTPLPILVSREGKQMTLTARLNFLHTSRLAWRKIHAHRQRRGESEKGFCVVPRPSSTTAVTFLTI